ncbi:ribonuclease P protein component [Subtercola endophyticus]|nr:ribonuclease P protein component [Subtercola endophyticus]
MRRGARFTVPTGVVYVRRTGSDDTRFGFIVSKQVGNAVVRNRIRRRLKAACYAVRVDVAPGADVVIRALPNAATASYAQLSNDLGKALIKSSLLTSSSSIESS